MSAVSFLVSGTIDALCTKAHGLVSSLLPYVPFFATYAAVFSQMNSVSRDEGRPVGGDGRRVWRRSVATSIMVFYPLNLGVYRGARRASRGRRIGTSIARIPSIQPFAPQCPHTTRVRTRAGQPLARPQRRASKLRTYSRRRRIGNVEDGQQCSRGVFRRRPPSAVARPPGRGRRMTGGRVHAPPSAEWNRLITKWSPLVV